jgi:eukaryotic-like serine/threonine-protein kinase
MTNFTTTPTPSRTLAQRLAEGRIPLSEALTCSMILAEALRKMHDSGRAHGAVSPSNIVIGGSGLELLPALLPSGATPYTAPEVLEGHQPDARSDIFSFGAVVYEMLTGRKAFEGDGPAALAAAIVNSKPPTSGSPAADRLLAGCLAKDPAARLQRMQKVLLELKLLTVAARRAEAPAARADQFDAAIGAHMQKLEARMVTRFEAHDRKMLDIERGAAEALTALHGQLTSLGIQVTSALEHAGSKEVMDAAEKRIADQVDQKTEAVGQRVGGVEQSVGSLIERLLHLEQGLDSVRQDSVMLQRNVAADLQEFEQKLKSQASAIESVRTAMAQTDDLVERVVEALELLQSSVIERSEERGTITG